MQIFQICQYLFQTGKNGKSPALRILAEENIKRHLMLSILLQKVAVRHRQLVEIHDHADIAMFTVRSHVFPPPLFRRKSPHTEPQKIIPTIPLALHNVKKKKPCRTILERTVEKARPQEGTDFFHRAIR